MKITAILSWVKSLTESFEKPASYGSALESYIVSREPKDACDVDRLTREFDQRMSNRQFGGFPC